LLAESFEITCVPNVTHQVDERKADWAYELEVSVMEIYNEKLRDLLSGKKAADAELAIKHGR
jgi:kinesin family protein C2/C3